jgi:hypothetical protein
LLQYRCPGFVVNRRQHRQFGLAAVEVAQVAAWNTASTCLCDEYAQSCATTKECAVVMFPLSQLCQRHWSSAKGVQVLDSASSKPSHWGGPWCCYGTSNGASLLECCLCAAESRYADSTSYWRYTRYSPPLSRFHAVAGSGSHPLGWRDVFDTAVRWRQESEPFDPVFYVDGMTHKGFEEGFGLQTPMTTGQARVVRYYSEVCDTTTHCRCSIVSLRCPVRGIHRVPFYFRWRCLHPWT